MIGNLYLEKNDQRNAQKYFEGALAVNPNFSAAVGNLAWTYAEQGTNLDVALSLAQKAKELAPKEDSITDTLGWVHYQRKSYALAVPILRDCVHQSPQKPLYHYHLGLALLGAGDKQAAKTELQAALRLKLGDSEANRARTALAEIR